EVLLDVRPEILLDAHHANHARLRRRHARAAGCSGRRFRKTERCRAAGFEFVTRVLPEYSCTVAGCPAIRTRALHGKTFERIAGRHQSKAYSLGGIGPDKFSGDALRRT